ncbi:MAG: hypothetical protein ACU0B7_10495 [Paracoccaceae bacterium]|uniref:hypothetical protein n=1 Tax=Seohaeicola saemankumensis TaxID=481181 RepID=UPI001E29FAE4|nr:hypothetical protein [Seohaeicola saemankumensis]MCD1625728.1 hypothetical protein [Seohaeicola saemankumensis]
MLTSIFSAIPLWVFPLLAGLVWLGRRAAQDRDASPWMIYALPLLGLMSLNRALGLPLAEVALTAMVIAYLTGCVLGYGVQPMWIVARDPKKIRLRGEWVTMITILGLFSLNFTAGMMQGLDPSMTEAMIPTLVFGAAAGLLSGSLAGRAIRVALWPVEAG